MPGCPIRWYGGASRYNSTHFCCCQKSYNGLEYYQVSGIYNARPRTLNLTPSVTSPVALCSLWHAQMLLLSRCLRHTGLYSNIRPPILNLNPLSPLALPDALSDARMPLSRCGFSGGCILKCGTKGWNYYRFRFVILLLLLPSQVLCCKMVYMMLKRSLSRITFMTRNNEYIATVGLDIIWVRTSTCNCSRTNFDWSFRFYECCMRCAASCGATSTRIFSYSFHAITVESKHEVVGFHGVAIMLPKNLSTSNESRQKWATSLCRLCGNLLVSLVRISYLHPLNKCNCWRQDELCTVWDPLPEPLSAEGYLSEHHSIYWVVPRSLGNCWPRQCAAEFYIYALIETFSHSN